MTRPREKDGGQQRLSEGFTEDERWGLIKMVNAKVVLFLLCLCGALCCCLLLSETCASLIAQTPMILQVNQLQDRSSGDEITASRNRRAPRASSAGQSGDNGSMQSDQPTLASLDKSVDAEASNNLLQELLALRETASRVNTAHHLWRQTTTCEGTETPASSKARKEPTASAQSAATSTPSAMRRHAYGCNGDESTAGAAQDDAAAQTHAKSAAAPLVELALSLETRQLPPQVAAHRPDAKAGAAAHVRDFTPPRLMQFQALSRANEVLSRDLGAAAYPWTLVSAERHQDNLIMAKVLAAAISQTRDLKHTISPDFDTSRRPSPRPLPPSPNPSSVPPIPPIAPFVRPRSPARSPPRSPISPSVSSRSLSPVTRKATPYRARNESMSPSRFV